MPPACSRTQWFLTFSAFTSYKQQVLKKTLSIKNIIVPESSHHSGHLTAPRQFMEFQLFPLFHCNKMWPCDLSSSQWDKKKEVWTISGKGLWKGRAESTSAPLCLYIFDKYIFWLHHVACGILVPPPGTEPMPSALEVLTTRNLNHWTTTEVPRNICLKKYKYIFSRQQIKRKTLMHRYRYIYNWITLLYTWN